MDLIQIAGKKFKQAQAEMRCFSLTFWVVITATLINQIGNMAFIFLVLYTTKHLGFSLTQGSFVFAAFSGSMLLSGFLGGRLVDKKGPVPIMISSLTINGLTLLLFPLVSNFYLFIAMCLCWGASFGIYRPAAHTLVSFLAPANKYKITFSIYRLAINIGMSIGPLIGGYLAVHSFASIFIVNGIANMAACSILFIGLSKSIVFQHRPTSASQKNPTLKWLKKNQDLCWLIFGMIPASMVFFLHQSPLSLFVHNDLHFSLHFYGLIFTTNTLLVVLFELPLNIITNHWSYRLSITIGASLIMWGFGGMYFASTQAHIIALVALWTFGEIILLPATTSYAAEIAPHSERGLYMSAYTTSMNLGMFLGPWGGALIMQEYGSSSLWCISGLWGLLSVLIFLKLKEPQKENELMGIAKI